MLKWRLNITTCIIFVTALMEDTWCILAGPTVVSSTLSNFCIQVLKLFEISCYNLLTNQLTPNSSLSQTSMISQVERINIKLFSTERS